MQIDRYTEKPLSNYENRSNMKIPLKHEIREIQFKREITDFMKYQYYPLKKKFMES